MKTFILITEPHSDSSQTCYFTSALSGSVTFYNRKFILALSLFVTVECECVHISGIYNKKLGKETRMEKAASQLSPVVLLH